MDRQQPSIFNDIVGPIMVGPSSSHTCGPARIGFLSRQLLRSPVKKAVIGFAETGAYTNMYKGQCSDLGFVSGLLGYRPEDPNLRKSFALAKERGVDIQFSICDFSPVKPNHCILKLIGEQGEQTEVHTDSTGGGTVRLFQIDGFETDIVGDCYELLIVAKEEMVLQNIAKQFPIHEGIMFAHHQNQWLLNVKLRESVSEANICQLSSIEGIYHVRQLEPILAVLSGRNQKLPFISAKEMLETAKVSGKALWELGLDYEMARSGWSREQVLDYMRFVVETMESGVVNALEGNINMNGILSPTAGKIMNYRKAGKPWLDMGVLDYAVPWSMATMEYSSAMGVVLCAPTGGSAGVFPGAVLGTATKLGLPMADKVKAMLVTSVVGIVMSKDCNYSAELYGCQVEPGAASAMAAAALVWMLGGTAEQSCMAASCALQNILGTICDPVAGLVQLPCINRNAMSAANAVVCANIVIAGFDPLIPLDESAETLFRVGKQLPSELRCTCKGGLCITESGIRLAQEQDIRNENRS